MVGRPVHFVNDDSDDDGDRLAKDRLRRALTAAGFDDVRFELEPVAAAWRYEQRLKTDELVLIADFGGGTTDLCLVHGGPSTRALGRTRVVATDGVGLAGDAHPARVPLDAEQVAAFWSGYRMQPPDTAVPSWFQRLWDFFCWQRCGARMSDKFATIHSMASRKKGSNDEQVVILRAIWSEMKGLNSRVDKTNERLDAVRTELKEEIGTLERRVVESEVRLATATTQLSGDVHELSGLIREWRTEHRADRADLKSRVDRIERHLGLS